MKKVKISEFEFEGGNNMQEYFKDETSKYIFFLFSKFLFSSIILSIIEKLKSCKSIIATSLILHM